MSGQSPNQPPSRGGWNRAPQSPILYRPPSPWAPSPPPIISGPRRLFDGSPVGGQMTGPPMSPSVNSLPRSQPMSPLHISGGTGLRGTRGVNVTQPRPKWPAQSPGGIPPPHTIPSQSPLTLGGVSGPRMYRPKHTYSPGPTSSFQLSPTPSPIVCQLPPEYVYNGARYEQPTTHSDYVGVPLEPPQPKSYIIYDDEVEQGPSTAEIIANQSQDYIDEKLAEYQMTILQLQEEQERVQKKTFVNWINSYLSKRIPPLRIDDLIYDLRDGTKLLALLEVLSGEKLPVEKGRVLRRPHFLSNANTALQFLASKKIKLVNINPADLVDGRPPVVLGLIWTIILYFQIEENSKALRYLDQGLSGSMSSLDSITPTMASVSDAKAEKWKQGARKTLLQWVTNALPKDAGIEVRDFGTSWRDGVAFLALIDAIKANLINLADLRKTTNRARLETAFDVAEAKLGIAKLLDAEDVDVDKPDEKSIMTYVAQFLHKYPEPRGTGYDGIATVQEEYEELRKWLIEKTNYYQPMANNNSFPRDFAEYLMARADADMRLPLYNKIKNLFDSQASFMQLSRQSWEEIEKLWRRLQYQLLLWLWLLDSELPGDFGTVGKWLAQAEKLLIDDDIPTAMNEETASIISRKLEEHKTFFADLPRIIEIFENAKRSPLAKKIPMEQLKTMERRLYEVGPNAAERRIRLKFLEHKCCLIAFLNLVENKLRGWTGKYSYQDKVQQLLEQYKSFVSRNKIFQEFSKALDDMQQVVEEYKRDGNISKKESLEIDKFMKETEERWNRVSMELRCCLNSLEEVLACWKVWNSASVEFEEWLNLAEKKAACSEDERLEFFQNISIWQEKYHRMTDSVNYLIASCEDRVSADLREKQANLSSRWERLFSNTKQYMHAGDIIRSREEFKQGMERLSTWLRNAERVLNKQPLGTAEHIKCYGEELQKLAGEVDEIEDLFKNISKTFQGLIQDLSRDEVEKMMATLKKEKESLVRVRAQIPVKLHLFHQLLIQQESLEAGILEIHQWLDEAEGLLGTLSLSGSKENINEQLNKHKTYFSRTLYYRSMLDSKNKVFQSLLKTAATEKSIDTSDSSKKMQQLNDRFTYVTQHAQQWDQRLQEAARCWHNFKESERIVNEWLLQAETLLQERHIDSKNAVDTQKVFFEHANERWMTDLVQTAQELLKCLPQDEQKPIINSVEKLQGRWRDVLSQAPLHLMKLEFRIEETNFYQHMKEVNKELHLEQQAFDRNEDVDSILSRNQSYFKTQGTETKIEKCLENMKRISTMYSQHRPNDNLLPESCKSAEDNWMRTLERIEDMRRTLQQIPAQWDHYHQKFKEMVDWMDMVDKSLKNIVNEVNSMEEFEKERVVFQKICQEADNKREDMKWLVRTLDSLLSYTTEDERSAEQKKLEGLISRYKNLIPTIEITMVKTEVFSKCYTYRREVHEVVCLLNKVKEQTINTPAPDSLEKVNKMIQEQQYAINQLDHQRTHIMSMLQRGRDLSKDVHAPSFVGAEVKNLETGWNEAYTETVDKLKSLKGTQTVWNEFVEQKTEIMNLLHSAETELRALTPLQTDPKNVSQDLHAKRELNANLQQASHHLIPRLHELCRELSPHAAPVKRPILEKEVVEVEKMFFNTMEHVKDRVGYLEDYSAKWNTYKARLAELQEWANRVAPKLIEALQSEDLTPEERVVKTNNLRGVLSEKMKQLDNLGADAAELAPKEGNIAEAKRLKGEIYKLQEVLSAVNRNVEHQAQVVHEDLVNWQKYQAGIQEIKPRIEQSEMKVNAIMAKPATLQETVQLQQQAKLFENQCQEQLDKLQGISTISHQMLCKTNAPDELDAMHSRWAAVHDNAKQITNKFDKLVSNWQSFDADATKLETWIENGGKIISKRPSLVNTPHVDKLEKELVKLKSFNNEISEQQAKIVSLGQVSDHIAMSLSPEGAAVLRDRVNAMKAQLSSLSEQTRGKINEISDAIMARQDFNAKIANFSNWMDHLQGQIAQVEEINPERVEPSLHLVHSFLQEHSDKKPNFGVIYDEVKQLSLSAAPDEANVLNESYTSLVSHFQDLEKNMQQKKSALESWNELLGWKNETENHLNHLRTKLEKSDKPDSGELAVIIEEIDDISKSLVFWKGEARKIDDYPAVHLRDSLTRRPLSAVQMVNDLESKLDNLKIRSQNQRVIAEQMVERKTKFQELERAFAQGLNDDKIKLEQVLRLKPNAQNINQIIADLEALNQAIQSKADLKDKIHDEGAMLMKEDIGSMPIIQDSLLVIDKCWDNLREEIADRLYKYNLISQALKDFAEVKDRFDKELAKAQGIHKTIPVQPKDEVELHQASEKTKKAVEQTRKCKTVLDDLDRKGNGVLKLFESIGEESPEAIKADVEDSKAKWQELFEKTSKNVHLFETEAVIWNQIEEAKRELLPWLSETNQSLCDSADNTIEIEFGPIRLNKYRAELPSYLALKSSIEEKTKELVKINNNEPIPALSALNQLLAEQFAEVEHNAQRLDSVAQSFNDQENELRKKIKTAGEAVSKLRESLIKCDDMSGDNNKIIERLNQCRALKAELDNVGDDIDNLRVRVDEMKAVYPTFGDSIIPKELNNVQKRFEGVHSHAKKIEGTLLQFLRKFHDDKVGMLKRLISTQKEKVMWCVPESSSDKYNLDVKRSTLQEVQKSIAECENRQDDILKSLQMLQAIESPQNVAAQKAEVETLNANLKELRGSFDEIKGILEENADLWNQYETANEEMSAWLRDVEGKVKVETGNQMDLSQAPKKLNELQALQKDIENHKPIVNKLEQTSQLLIEKNPEARIGQFVTHLIQRYHTMAKSLAAYIDKMRNAQKINQNFEQAVKDCAEWLSDAKIEFNELARMGSPGSSSATAQQLKVIKDYIKTFENGQILLNNVVDIGEELYPVITPENREKIRADLRKLREQFDYLRDEANALLQQTEAVLIQKTSIEESYTQVSQWLTESKTKVASDFELYPTLAAKKAALQKFKTQLQEINLHKNALKQLQDKASNLADDESERKAEESIQEYNQLAVKVTERLNACQNFVINHEAYDQILEKAQDWLNTIKSEAIDILNDITFEKDGAEEKLIVVENLIQQKPEGNSIFEACKTQLDLVLKQTHPSGHPALIKSFEEPKRAWDDFMALCEDSFVKLKQLCSKWEEFENIIDGIDLWMKNIESVVKDQSLKSTVEAKQAHLKKLREMLKEIEERTPAINDLMEQGREIEGETDLNLKLSRINTRFQTIKNTCKEAISKYEGYLKDHKAFNKNYDDFKKALEESMKELKKNNEIVGDLSILQDRQRRIREMSDQRINDSTAFEELIDQGEKLYSHTSPDGREIIRQQLRNLRTMWDNYTDDLNSATQKLDHCLLQFGEFTAAQEQLTKWLRDVEKAMQSHTELKTTLQEKRAQLQNHKLMHQEIMAHNALVDNVCDKAQSLVDQTKDTSLNVYLQSIKKLFQNIVRKSEELLGNLENCVQSHSDLNNVIASSKAWISSEKEKLLDCDDTYGEKSDIKRKIAILDQLSENKPHGDKLLDDIRQQFNLVKQSTSPKGIEVLEKEISEIETTFKSHFNDIEGIEGKQKDVLNQWDTFEKSLDELTKWCRSAESVFREQQLQSSLENKVSQLEKYKAQREKILQKEKEIDAFADSAHSLINNCGADRLKNLTSQITNRYQLLQVMSKEVVNRWQNMVEDHQNYTDKLKEIDLWLQSVEKNLEMAGKEEPISSTNILQLLLSEKEQAEHLFSSLNTLGEKVLPETSTQGREKIRQELRDIRDRWDKLNDGIKNLQKRQEAQSIQWSSYQDILKQTLAWLESVEKLLQNECPSTWTSAQEIRSKLFKYKGTMQDINSHKRGIEAVNEKANTFLESSGSDSIDAVQKTLSDINTRYEKVSDVCNKLLSQLEEAFEVYQQFSELQKSQQDYQKNLWDRLTAYSDYSGNKMALQARLMKIIEIQDTLPEGTVKLQLLSEHVEKHANAIPARSKEAMSRDLDNLYADFEKFAASMSDVKSNLENRLQQWNDYEINLDRLIERLGEAENSLRNYCPKATLEEKLEQFNKFQSLSQSLRQNEVEFEKMKDDTSELIQSSGETRIAVNVQQVTSRFQSIQTTAKEILKKCEQAVHDHQMFNEKYKQCSEWVTSAKIKYNKSSDLSGVASREDLIKKQIAIQELQGEHANATLLLNTAMELGEKCYPTTSSEGREMIRAQLQELELAFEQLFDNIMSTSRQIQGKVAKWSGFDDIVDKLQTWLNGVEKQLSPEIELKTTLDEKRAKLQVYRDILNDMNNHQVELGNLQEIANNLPEETEHVKQKLAALTDHFTTLHKRAQSFVERYEGIVSDHQLYCKAVMDTQEFIDATSNTVNLWGDLDLERVSLHTNLDRLKNLQSTLADEFPRVAQVQGLGEKVIPGTSEVGQKNIQAQIDSTQQEWEGLLSAIKSTIESIEGRLLQWTEFEKLRDQCLDWIRGTDSRLHAIDLKAFLPEKKNQLETLKEMQGEVRAKELEIDNVSEKGQQLHKGPTGHRVSQVNELVLKYQQVSHKVKEFNNRWQQYVSSHQDFDSQVAEITHWMKGIQDKLAYCSDLGALSQKDLEGKLNAIQEVILLKDEGSMKIQALVELAQIVLANTAPAGHESINKAIAKIQEDWSTIALKMIDVKANLDDSINQWSGFLEQVQNVKKTVDWLENILKDLSEFQTTMSEKRAQLDRIKGVEEKVRMEKIDVDALKAQAVEMLASGQQSQAAYQAQNTLDKFDELADRTNKLLADREEQYRDHRLYKEGYDDLVSWISRAREKFPSLRQSSLSDKLAIENAVAATEALLNKQAQGELLVEHLVHTGEVVLASTSPQGQEIIRNDIRALRDSFESLFREIIQQKEQLEVTLLQWRDYKEEYDRLLEWLQQIDIMVKSHKLNLYPDIKEKQKQVNDMHDIMKKLEKGNDDIDKFNQSASGLLASHLDTYVTNQLRHLNSMYQVQLNLAKDVLKKVEGNLEQHKEYERNLQDAHKWIENAKDVIRQCSEASGASSREFLQANLDKIQDLIRKREDGQSLVHTTINNGEKVLRTTRSDGRDVINVQMKELQSDWDRLIKKMSTAKVHLETSLLQWADYSSSFSQLQQWISEREAKLQQVGEQKLVKSQKGQPGLSVGLSERKANLRQINNIVQDIVSFEPMIQSVTSKASDLRQGAPATEISAKYETLNKQAKDLYEKQKNTIDQHQALIEAGNEFAQWLRNAKERLSKCAEPTGDKDILASKTHQLTILESEIPAGQSKLDKALHQGEIACRNAGPEDREIIEEEVALLQEEFDAYVEALKNAKGYLEVGIVKWTDYQDQYTDALEWLNNTEALVQSYNKLQENLAQKKNVLEEFQGHLQTLFDWQKELDHLNVKAQILLETCADTRISNAITQLTTKYNALLTLAKEVMRRLELHYQEHQQHHTLYEECQSWIEKTRERLNDCQTIPSTLNEVQIKLNTIKNLRQGFEQGQNKLRYLLELKEKVIMNTELSGAAKIHEDTEALKQDYEKLLVDINEVKQKLLNRAAQLEEIYKVYKVLMEWLQEIEMNIRPGDELLNDLSEKRTALEKFRVIQRDINGHSDIIEKIKNRLRDDENLDKNDFVEGLNKFENLQEIVGKHIENLENQVNNHEKYKEALSEAQDWVRKTKIDIEQCSDSHGEKDNVTDKLNKLREIEESMPEGMSLLDGVEQFSQNVIATSGSEGQDLISQEIRQLKYDWESLQAALRDARNNLESCITSWTDFLNKYNKINKWIEDMNKRIRDASETESKSSDDLVQARRLLEEVQGENDAVEDLNEVCEILMEHSACSRVRDQTVATQANYTKLLTAAQGLVAKTEKSLSDHTEFLNYKTEMSNWIQKANSILEECPGSGDLKAITTQLETANSLSSRLPEGQQLFEIVKDSYTKATNVIPEDKQQQLRDHMNQLRDDWDNLNISVKKTVENLKHNQNRWSDFDANKQRMEKWLKDTQDALNVIPDSKGEVSEMKTLLERYKGILGDIEQKGKDLKALYDEANNLGAESDEIHRMESQWDKLKNDCEYKIKSVGDEICDYNGYHQCMQDVEKWLLQISFQLMAHNSLFISNRDQTLEQIKQHEALLDEIQKYQSNVDDLNSKGQNQIERYQAKTPSIRDTIETQLKNIQDSYNSLLHTSVQIKNRLHESLAKFQEYEDTLLSIMRNLEETEPLIQSELDTPAMNLETAQKQLAFAHNIHNKLQGEKTRLALAVQACEAATASISRPSSPLETAMQPIPERELVVRAKLEDLIDQVQSHLDGLSATVHELEQQQKQRAELQDWIKKQQGSVSDWESRPCKLRPEAAKQELVAMNDLLNVIGDKRSQLMTDMTGSFADDDTTDLEDQLNQLESELMDAIAKKQSGQNIIDGYRQSVQDIQSWFDSLIKRMDVLDKGSGLNCAQKLAAILEIKGEFEDQGPKKMNDLKLKAANVTEIISNLDGQQVEEQMKSIERRYNDLEKRIERKAQLLEVTNKGLETAKNEIDQIQNWVKQKIDEIQAPPSIGYEAKSAEARQLQMKGLQKDADAKQSLSETLEKRIANMQHELEPVEYSQLESALRNLGTDLKHLFGLLKTEMDKAQEAAKTRKQFEIDLDKTKTWIKNKLAEVRKSTGFQPLTSAGVAKEIQLNKKHEDDIKHFQENVLNDVMRQASNILRECPQNEGKSLQKLLDDINSDYNTLKEENANKLEGLAELLQNRKNFEENINKLNDWLNEVEIIISGELRTVNLPIMEEQLAKYKSLEGTTKEMGSLLGEIVEQGKAIAPHISNADKFKSNEEIKNLKEKYTKLCQNINDRCKILEDHINKYKDAKRRLAECIQFLNNVQQRLRELNKPIGSKIEDVRELLGAYEQILDELKESKSKMGDLQAEYLPELQTILGQQNDMIKLIEDQLAHLKQLLLLREQFIALINEIIAFIMKYTDVINEIEQSPDSLESKIKQYDDVIVKIQECEALLASANDKGQKIASEGTAADRNSITEQLQSLKNQLQNLRKAVEAQKQKHQIALDHHKKLGNDLNEILDWLHQNEALAKSRPLLDRDPDSVEREIQKHFVLAKDIQKHLDDIEKLIEKSQSEVGLPSSLLEIISEGKSLLSSLPNELADREKYLASNKQSRLDYMNLVAKFNAWVHEAEIRLQNCQHGIDYENVQKNIEEHKLFFNNDMPIKTLVHSDILEAANKIRPSLNNLEQEELSRELQQHQQILKNILNSAKSQQSLLEKEANNWKEYCENCEKVKVFIEKAEFSDEPITKLAGLRSNIQKINLALKNIQAQNADIDLVNKQSQVIIRQADSRNRENIEQENLALNEAWSNLIGSLESRRESLSAVAERWEEFEEKLHTLEKSVGRLEEKSRHVDSIVKSRRHLEETKNAIQEILAEAQELKSSYKEIEALSKSIVTFLGEIHKPSAEAIRAKVDQLADQYEKLITSLHAKDTKAAKDLEDIEEIFRKISDLQDRFNTLSEELSEIHVFDVNQKEVEDKLAKSRNSISANIGESAALIKSTQDKYLKQQNLIPSDISQELTSLELLSERLQGAMDTKDKEFKRARTIRTEYLTGVEEVRTWLQNAEIKILDRSLEPLKLREVLYKYSQELGGIYEKLGEVNANGNIIVENSRNNEEKELVKNTVDQLTQQLDQLRSLLDEKKQQVGDSLDAWTRFMNLYQIVLAWVAGKKVFLEESLRLTTLQQARQRLNEYAIAVKSVKPITKHLSEMDKELELIAQVTTVGDLKDKLQEVETAKIEVEALLVQRNALLQETVEEWDQCEKKIKDIRSWIEKTRSFLESPQHKKKSLRDQLGFCEKTVADINVQKTKLSLSIEKLEVHFKAGIGGDPRLAENVDDLLKVLDELNVVVMTKVSNLEETLSQIDLYQQQMQSLRQKIVHEEQQLRTLMAPSYLPQDREKAMVDQQSCRERIKILHSKITARNERVKLLIYRGTPDDQALDT